MKKKLIKKIICYNLKCIYKKKLLKKIICLSIFLSQFQGITKIKNRNTSQNVFEKQKTKGAPC